MAISLPRQPDTTLPRVLAMVGERDGCSLWRIFQPYATLQRRGINADWGYRDDEQLVDLVHHYQAVILPRLHWRPEDRAGSRRWFRALNDAGIAVIYEVDDDMLSGDFYRRLVELHGVKARSASDIRDGVRNTIENVDGVTVSTERLATQMRQHTTRPVQVVPNFIDLPWFRFVQKQAGLRPPELRDKINIGWAGGIRGNDDFEMMAEAWELIAAEFPETVFTVMGFRADVLDNRIPEERIRLVKWQPIDTYPAGMAHIDIGCCPLAPTPFNRCKTPIKAFEYGATGAAVVASPTVYGKVIEDGVTGSVVSSVEGWYLALRRLVEDEWHRKTMAEHWLRAIKERHALEATPPGEKIANVLRWPVAWQLILEDFRERQKRPRIIVPRSPLLSVARHKTH